MTRLEDLVETALEGARKSFPPLPRVVDLRYRIGSDATGETAVWIWVVLDDATPKSGLRHTRLKPIAAALREVMRLLAEESTRPARDVIPYVRFRLKSEQDEVDRELGAA